MKNKNFKKLFCVMLSASTLISSCAGAVSTESATKKINFEKVKKVAKDAAPWLAVGVPAAAFIVVGSVLLAKSRTQNSESADQQSDDLDKTDDSDEKETQTTSQPKSTKTPQDLKSSSQKPVQKKQVKLINVNCNLPKRGLNESVINGYIDKCELPGIKFYFVNPGIPGYLDYCCYIITDVKALDMYLNFIGASETGKSAIKSNQNNIIYQNNALFSKGNTINDIFSCVPVFAKHFSDIVAKMLANKGSHYLSLGKNDNKKEINKAVIQSKQGARDAGMDPLFVAGIVGSEKEEEKKEKEEKEEEKKEKEEKEKEEKVEEEKVEEEKVEEEARTLAGKIADSDSAVGNEAQEELYKRTKAILRDNLQNGRIEGIQFYRYKSKKVDVRHLINSQTTHHWYVITDYDKASKFFSGDQWAKVVAYQNRILYKRGLIPQNKVLNFGGTWGIEKLFDGFESGFGECFDEITALKPDKREGMKDCKELPEGVNMGDYGKPAVTKFEATNPHDKYCGGLSRIMATEYEDPEDLFDATKKLLEENHKLGN